MTGISTRLEWTSGHAGGQGRRGEWPCQEAPNRNNLKIIANLGRTSSGTNLRDALHRVYLYSWGVYVHVE